MKTKIIALMLLATVSLTACKSQRVNERVTINYGTSFGMCVNYCKQSIAIEFDKITFTKSKNGSNPDPKTCQKAISNEQFETLISDIDMDSFDKLEEVIGCPDCADGGAEWVEIIKDGKRKRVTFEYGKAPKELKVAVAKFKEVKESFSTCN